MDRISKIESLVGQTVRRDISRLVNDAKGNIGAAASSILSHVNPHIAIISGFFIQFAEPPSPETDGLNGTAQLAAALLSMGIEVTVITDAPCAKAMWAVLTEVPYPVRLEVVGTTKREVLDLRERLSVQRHPPTHIVAIERVAPGADGRPYREHGWDMSDVTAPLDLLFHDENWDRPWKTIGIGDGGNEMGMGSLSSEVVKNNIPNGDLIASRTPADFLIVSGVSNWGAYGLIGAMAALKPEYVTALFRHFTGEMEQRYLKASVELGQAVDDSRVDRPGRPQMSIDRLKIDEHIEVIQRIRHVAENG